MDNLEKMMQQILAQINANQEKAEAFQEKMDANQAVIKSTMHSKRKWNQIQKKRGRSGASGYPY
jgi:prefoldin subunit 5